MHADLGQATARENPVAPTGPEGVGEGEKTVSLPRPWGVLGNGGAEEHGERDKGGGGPPASTEKGRLWRWKERRQREVVVTGPVTRFQSRCLFSVSFFRLFFSTVFF